jgi:uncharacterized membrane protein YfcA
MEGALTFDIIAIAVAGGLLAGFVNTLAGNGSAITLGILIELIGLPGQMANGTNRVGIFLQCIASTFAFQRNGMVDWAGSLRTVLLVFVGAMVGVGTALKTSDANFVDVYRYLMLVMLLVLIVKPKRWIRGMHQQRKLHVAIEVPMLLALGFYGGYIQMGMGIFLLAFFVLGQGRNLMQSNVLKILVVTAYTIVVFGLFAFNGLVVWKIGAVIGLGQLVGGWATAHYASRMKSADLLAYVVLLLVVIAVVIKNFIL